MATITDDLRSILIKNHSLEVQITPSMPAPTGLIPSLLDINTQLVDLRRRISKDPLAKANKVLLELLASCRSCNIQRIKILTKLLQPATDVAAHGYSDYRYDTERLAADMKKRASLTKRLELADFKAQEKLRSQLTAHMHTEDVAIIELLIAASCADGIIHKNETRLIKQYYKKITLRSLDESELAASYKHIGTNIDQLIIDLTKHSTQIYPAVRQSMFLSALDVAVADHFLRKPEIDLLLRVAKILRITNEEGQKISKPEQIVALLKQKRQIKHTPKQPT